MKNTAIIIPTRLKAKRFPNKPLAKINNTPMILHVLNRAKESKVGEVFVATPDEEIFDLINKQKRSDRLIIFATHNRFFADKADCLLEMRDGSIKSSNV